MRNTKTETLKPTEFRQLADEMTALAGELKDIQSAVPVNRSTKLFAAASLRIAVVRLRSFVRLNRGYLDNNRNGGNKDVSSHAIAKTANQD